MRVENISMQAKAPDVLAVDATTSTGFYVRSLAHDIGIELGCGGYLQHLHRTSIGPYTAAEAFTQEALQAAETPEDVIGGAAWIPIESISLPFPEIDLNTAAAEWFIHGQEVMVFNPGQTELKPAPTWSFEAPTNACSESARFERFWPAVGPSTSPRRWSSGFDRRPTHRK